MGVAGTTNKGSNVTCQLTLHVHDTEQTETPTWCLKNTLCVIPGSVSSKMFVVRPFNPRKVMWYSFYLLIVSFVFYVVICLAAYHVDAKEKKLPAGESPLVYYLGWIRLFNF